MALLLYPMPRILKWPANQFQSCSQTKRHTRVTFTLFTKIDDNNKDEQTLLNRPNAHDDAGPNGGYEVNTAAATLKSCSADTLNRREITENVATKRNVGRGPAWFVKITGDTNRDRQVCGTHWLGCFCGCKGICTPVCGVCAHIIYSFCYQQRVSLILLLLRLRYNHTKHSHTWITQPNTWQKMMIRNPQQ